MASNTCDIVVGRLMEITVDGGYHSPDDVDTMIAMIGARFASLPAATSAVVAADWRGVHLMKPDTATRAHAMLTRVSPRIERSAILVHTTSSMEMLQFVRLVRESHHPSRRIFDQPSQLHAWLAEVLTPVESSRLLRFVGREPVKS
jgi:hypothetical protein